jgi:ABC-type amino acid transport system permease subunit
LWLEDNITGSWFQTAGVALLLLITAFYTIGQLGSLPVSTIIIVVTWLIGILLVAVGKLLHKPTGISRWLKTNLLSSASNTLMTLVVVLVIVAALNGAWTWGVTKASFDPFKTAPEDRGEGATWGVLSYPRGEEGVDSNYRPGGMKLMTTGRMKPDDIGRVWLSLVFILGLWLATYISGRPRLKEQLKIVRRVTSVLWLFSPVLLYIFLAGIPEGDFGLQTAIIGAAIALAVYALLWWQRVIAFSVINLVITVALWPLFYTIWWGIGQSGVFPPINVDDWGGFMLTIIIASSVIILSLPLGMVLALARQSDVYGIPAWIVWPVAIVATIWGFTTTPDLLATSRNTIEQLMSFWPVLILLVAYFFQRFFKGNMVSGGSTSFIELIRSVPLITLLFMGINMAPFFLAAGTSVAKPWPVIVAYTLFSSAYMAETIRGGLQAIPRGQYEAADSLGFNALQKMRFIILPQALRVVIPAIVGQFIGAYKSSSLVSIVGLFDFLGSNRLVLSNERWFGLRIEVYLFMGIVYFLGSAVMSAYSRRLETRLSVGQY